MKRLIFCKLIILFLTASCSVYGQSVQLKHSVYFDFDQSAISPEGKNVLLKIADSLRANGNYTLSVEGHTDLIAPDNYNHHLSEQRINAVVDVLAGYGVDQARINRVPYGETKPIGDNYSASGRQMNRRVDIIIRLQVPELTEPVSTLYDKIGTPLQTFSINPRRDTLIMGSNGTIVHVPANVFNTTSTADILLHLKESFLPSEMFMDNLTTTSNGKLLESDGMVYLDAVDASGQRLSTTPNGKLAVMLPTESYRSDMQLFRGDRNGDQMNWMVTDREPLSDFNLWGIANCGSVYVKTCPFFTCQIRNFFYNVTHKGKRVKPRDQVVTGDNCVEWSVLQSIGITNMDAVAQLLAGRKFVTRKQMVDAINDLARERLVEGYESGDMDFVNYRYYVFNTRNLGWLNLDAFKRISANQQVNMAVNLEAGANVDCKIVFKSFRSLISPTVINGHYKFTAVPRGEKVWVVAIKYQDGKPFLAMKETLTGAKTVKLEFEQLSFDELNTKLKILDDIGRS